MWVLFNTTVGGGQASFATPNEYVVGNVPAAMTVADLNGDGAPDLAIVNSTSSLSTSSNTLSVLMNTDFLSTVTLTTSANPVQVRTYSYLHRDLARKQRLSDGASSVLGWIDESADDPRQIQPE